MPVRTLTLDVFTGRVDELHDGNDIGGGRVHLLAAGWAGVEGSVLAHARHPTAGLLDSFAAQVVGDIRDGFVLRILTLDDARAWHKGEDEEQRQWFEFPGPAPFENVVAAIEPPTFEGVRKVLWLSKGLMEPETAQLFEAELPDDIRAMCHERLRELDDELEAELGTLGDN